MADYNSTNVFFSEKLMHPATKKGGEPVITKDGSQLVNISVPPKDGHKEWGQFSVPQSWIHEAKNGRKFVTFGNDKTIDVSYYKEGGKVEKMAPADLAKKYQGDREKTAEKEAPAQEAEAEEERE